MQRKVKFQRCFILSSLILVIIFSVILVQRGEEAFNGKGAAGAGSAVQNGHGVERERTRNSARVAFEDHIARYIRGDKTNAKQIENHINSKMIMAPFSARGVNPYAAKYYGLTKMQTYEVSRVASEVRLELMNKITARLVQSEASEQDQTVMIFRGSNELGDEVKRKLHDKLQLIVDSEFAVKCLSGLRTDGSYLGGGYLDLFVYIKPSRNAGALDDRSIRIEKRDRNGELLQDWVGSAKVIKEVLWLDFE